MTAWLEVKNIPIYRNNLGVIISIYVIGYINIFL